MITALPPSNSGAYHYIVIEVIVEDIFVGAAGASGTPDAKPRTVFEKVLSPITLIALTENWYKSSMTKSSTKKLFMTSVSAINSKLFVFPPNPLY